LDSVIPIKLAAAMGVLSVLWVIFANRWLAPRASTRLRLALMGFRLIALGMVFVCILRPSRKSYESVAEKPAILFLVDVSKSMAIKDADGESRVKRVERILIRKSGDLASMRNKYDLSFFAFGEKLRGLGDSFEAKDSLTAIGDALLDSVGTVKSGGIAAIVLITDGANNSGHDPLAAAGRLAEMRVPVFVLAVGREAPTAAVKDVKLSDIRLPRTAFRRSSVAVGVNIAAVSCKGQVLKATLLIDGEKYGEKLLRVQSDRERRKLDFSFLPQRAGWLKVTVAVEPIAGEIVAANNQISSYVRVLPKRLGVLYLEGSPRYEFKFIRRALASAPDIRLDARLIPDTVRNFDTLDDWRAFDVLLLGNLGRSAFKLEQLALIDEAVSRNGVGLAMLGNYALESLAGTPLANALPVEPESASVFEGKIKLRPTETGNVHPLMRLADDAEANIRAWESLPPLYAQIKFPALKPAARVLATGADGSPLIIAQRYGKGRMVLIATDETYRWAFARDAAASAYHARFWRNLVLWLAGGGGTRGKDIRIELSSHRVRRGETVRIVQHLPTGTVKRAELLIRKPNGDTDTFSGVRGALEFRPDIAGDYEIQLTAYDKDGKEIGRDTAKFVVYSSETELENPSADLDLLRRVAALTHGAFYLVGQEDQLFAQLRGIGQIKVWKRARLQPLWQTRLVLLIFFVAVCAEWLLRRLKGLV